MFESIPRTTFNEAQSLKFMTNSKTYPDDPPSDNFLESMREKAPDPLKGAPSLLFILPTILESVNLYI